MLAPRSLGALQQDLLLCADPGTSTHAHGHGHGDVVHQEGGTGAIVYLGLTLDQPADVSYPAGSLVHVHVASDAVQGVLVGGC